MSGKASRSNEIAKRHGVLRLALLLSPAILGGVFYLAVKLDHALFRSGAISARGAIGIELIVMLAFLVSLPLSIAVAMRSDNRWTAFAIAAVSIAVGLMIVGFGFESGAALLYAT